MSGSVQLAAGGEQRARISFLEGRRKGIDFPLRHTGIISNTVRNEKATY